MREVSIQIPALEAEQNVEIEVKINGKKRRLYYKVEIVDCQWNEDSGEERVEFLRKVIKEHDKDWKLVQIGAPQEGGIPVMFKKK